MKLRILLLTIVFGLLTNSILAQNNGCADYLKYYEAGDYENTISAILDCKSKNALSEQEMDKAEFYLQLSYGFTENFELVDAEKLEALMESESFEVNSSIVDALFVLTGFFYNKEYKYDISLEFGLKALSYAKQYMSFYSEGYASLLSSISEVYSASNDLSNAIEYEEQSLSIIKVVSGENSYSYASSLSSLSSYYCDIGLINKAIECEEQSLQIRKNIFGEEHLEYSISLNNLSLYYAELGDYKRAISYGEENSKITKSVLGENDTEYAATIDNLGVLYSSIGDFDKGLECGEKALNIRASVLGKDHEAYAASLVNLGSIYYDIGDYRKSNELTSQALNIREKIYGAKHYLCISPLNNLANNYSSLGDYSEAIKYLEQALKISEDVFGKQHPDYAASLSNLGGCYSSLGDYHKAIDYGEQALSIRESIYGKNHPDYAGSLNNLGGYYSSLGDYHKAIDYGEQALSIRESIYGKNHPDYAMSLNNLGSYYSYLGDYSKAIEYGERALKIHESLFGENHPDYARSLNNLGFNYSSLGDYRKAIEYGERALKIRESLFGEMHPDYATSLNNLGSYYSNLGDYRKAIEYGEQALKILELILGEEHPDYALSLNNLGSYCFTLGNYQKAIDYGEQALKICESSLGTEHPDYVLFLFNLGTHCFYIQDYDYSSRLILNGNKVKVEKIKFEFSWLAEYERGLYWAKEKYNFTAMPDFCYSSNNYSGFPELSYNSTLLSRGMLLQSSIELNKLLMESGDEEVINKAEDLRTLRATLNKLYEKPISERHLNTDSLERVSSKLEKVLLSMSKEYGDYTRFMDVNWEDVQAKLTEKDVAIEIVEFPVFKSDSIMYAAMVLRKDWEQPQMIPLFEKKEIVSFMDQTPSKQYSGYVGKQLYKLMWEPLESVVEEGNNVYFSPSGVYHQLAMEYLPTEEGTPLCDIYNMHRLSSTRQLVVENRDVAHKQAVLYGGIRYDVESDEMLAESKKYQQDESLYAHRGMAVDSLRGSQWVSLANTIPEVNFISGELEKHGIKSKVYSDTEANEESIKALSGKKVNILHLATHGFFLPIEETKKVEFYQMMGVDNNPAPDLSMRRSGLIMAGGNAVWTGKSIPEGVDDGVLTAQEISVLDFREMDMVVLSACETALGDIDTSEGVFGLQRAFKKAGVNTLLMSLWKVNDEVTKTLMNKFYQTLLSGKSKREAFLEAQRFVRNSHPDPKDWAAFVMVD